MTKSAMITALLLIGTISAHAGDNSCFGTVRVDEKWITVTDGDDHMAVAL